MKMNKYIWMLGLATMALTTACEDQSEQIAEVEYNRLFSPINLEARVVNEVNVRLTWSPVAGATSYTVEVYQNADQSIDVDALDASAVMTFDGSPVKSISGLTNADIPYVVTKLEGETVYTAAIQAMGEGISESKKSGIMFKTDAEQILQAVGADDLAATQVTLRWEAGEKATNILLTPGDINYTVTADDIAAGAATISGLTPETKYTAKLMNGSKTRGSISFETLIDLGGAVAVYPEDDFVTMLTTAEAGTVFALFPGTYTVASETGVGALTIGSNIEIKAVRPNDRPILNTRFKLQGGASLALKQVVVDGTGTDGGQAFEYVEATEYKSLIIDDCEVKNYTKGFYYVNVAATIDEITVNNCNIHGIECDGGDMFDCRAGAIKAINLTNNTIWNSCAARDFVRFDDKSSDFPGITPVITIDHCTLDGVSNNSSRRLLYVRFKGNSVVFTNNMVSNMPECGRGFSDNANTGVPTFGNNNYYNTINLVSDTSAKGKFFDADGTTLDPGYKDAANGDFTLSNEDLIYNKVGDPRWY